MLNMLFGVSAVDPMTFGAITLLLTFVALLACRVPARRAVRATHLARGSECRLSVKRRWGSFNRAITPDGIVVANLSKRRQQAAYKFMFRSAERKSR